MTSPLVVIGAGGFGRETLDVVAAINAQSTETAYEVLGVIDTNPSDINLQRLDERGVNYLGSESEWLNRGIPAEFLIAIGNSTVRERLVGVFESLGLTPATLIHPAARLGMRTTVSRGAIICSGAQISTNVTVGAHVHVNPNATVGHDSMIEDFASINPGAVVSGEVTVQSHALIGAGAVVLQGLTVGHNSIVGAAACVVRDVIPGTTVKGIPAS